MKLFCLRLSDQLQLPIVSESPTARMDQQEEVAVGPTAEEKIEVGEASQSPQSHPLTP